MITQNDTILKNNVLNFFKYPFKDALPYLTFDYIDDTGIYFLADTYFAFSLYSNSFKTDSIVKVGIIQNSYIKRNDTVKHFISFIPPRIIPYTRKAMRYIKQLIIPGNAEVLNDFDDNRKKIIEKYLKIYQSGVDVMVDDLFDFFRCLGCKIHPYTNDNYVRDHIGINMDVKEINGEPVFILNGIPIYGFITKTDPNKLFADFAFLSDKCFDLANMLVNNLSAYMKDGRIMKLCSLFFIGEINKDIITFFNSKGIYLHKLHWKTPVVFLNSLPMSVTYHELVYKDAVMIERIADNTPKKKELYYDRRKKERRSNSGLFVNEQIEID